MDEQAEEQVLGAEVVLVAALGLLGHPGRAAHARLDQLELAGGVALVLEALQVDNARAKGWSWQDIASRLGVTKQAVPQKHGPRSRSGPGR